MNILIENNTTTEYFTTLGSWTKVAVGGRPFATTMTALRAAKQLPIGKFTIVGHIPETGQFVNLNHGLGKGLPADGVPAAEPVKLAAESTVVAEVAPLPK